MTPSPNGRVYDTHFVDSFSKVFVPFRLPRFGCFALFEQQAERRKHAKR